MSLLIGVRPLGRNQKFDLGGKTLVPSATTWVNIDNKRVARDFARHGAIGQVVQAGIPFFQNDDGVVDFGGKVTVRATTLTVDVSAINATRASGAAVSAAAGTATLAAAHATDPRIDAVVFNTGTPGFTNISGTATAGTNLVTLAGRPTVPADRIVLAYVLVPATATTLSQANVVDVRP